MDELIRSQLGWLPEGIWVGWLFWELLEAAIHHGQCKLQRVDPLWFALGALPRHLVWWAGGFYAVLSWPQAIMILLFLWLLSASARYEGREVAQETSVYSALAGTVLNIVLLYYGGFWG